MKVSVILPSLNVVEYIEECIESVLEQKFSDIEMICIDAGSTDGTWEIINRYKKANDNIKAILSEKKSYGYQVNMGIQIATGEYVAILETDDYISNDMYGVLYGCAVENELDCVFADFDQFSGQSKKNRIYEKRNIINGCEGYYNRVLELNENYMVFTNTNYLWSGIYKRDFLIDNDIALNETSGAAYQDIGFINKVMMCAKRLMYIDKSLYRYRIDREGSSINSNKGIKNTYIEYKKLYEDGVVNGYESRFYYTMAYLFMGESYKLSIRSDDDWLKQNEMEFSWLKRTLLNAISKEYITEAMLPNGDWELVLSLIKNSEEHIKRIRFPGNSSKFYESIKDKDVVIFGAGIRGQTFYKNFCNRINILAFIDNQKEKHGLSSVGIPILGVDELCEMDGEIAIIVAIKNEGILVRDELINRGIQEKSIFVFDYR